jgi:SAM-dependent methyltransferase
MEPFYPLHARICDQCFLVQLEELESPEKIFNEYAYFSSNSQSWLRHSNEYAERLVKRFQLDRNALVIEVGSNDGYLLQYSQAEGIRVLGVEPAGNVAAAAEKNGIPTLNKFFGTAIAKELAAEGKQADLLAGNNVLAHTPQLNDFVAGLKLALKPSGIITLEFPHLLQLITKNQFDTIYHEHFSYFSFYTVEQIFLKHGLTVFDVEELSTHGGSLRVYFRHTEDLTKAVSSSVPRLRNREIELGVRNMDTYSSFRERVQEAKSALLLFLIGARQQGKSVVGYGAPAKANTLLNCCGIGRDLLEYTVDVSPHKQNHFLPGTHIPVYHPDRIKQTRPDYVLILPWNLREEIIDQMSCVHEWGGQFAIPIPRVEVTG